MTQRAKDPDREHPHRLMTDSIVAIMTRTGGVVITDRSDLTGGRQVSIPVAEVPLLSTWLNLRPLEHILAAARARGVELPEHTVALLRSLATGPIRLGSDAAEVADAMAQVHASGAEALWAAEGQRLRAEAEDGAAS